MGGFPFRYLITVKRCIIYISIDITYIIKCNYSSSSEQFDTKFNIIWVIFFVCVYVCEIKSPRLSIINKFLWKYNNLIESLQAFEFTINSRNFAEYFSMSRIFEFILRFIIPFFHCEAPPKALNRNFATKMPIFGTTVQYIPFYSFIPWCAK